MTDEQLPKIKEIAEWMLKEGVEEINVNGSPTCAKIIVHEVQQGEWGTWTSDFELYEKSVVEIRWKGDK